MSTHTVIPAELVHSLQERLERAARGTRDQDEMRRACEHMDQQREELQKRIGIVNVSIDLVRDARNPCD